MGSGVGARPASLRPLAPPKTNNEVTPNDFGLAGVEVCINPSDINLSGPWFMQLLIAGM
jgi:hypothetical protein